MITVKGHRVLVKVERLADTDEAYARAERAGIKILEDHEDNKRASAGLDRGTVMEVGPDAWKAFYINSNPDDTRMMFFRPWAAKGDFIAFAKYAGKFIEDPEDGAKYIVINDEDVVAVLKGKKNG